MSQAEKFTPPKTMISLLLLGNYVTSRLVLVCKSEKCAIRMDVFSADDVFPISNTTNCAGKIRLLSMQRVYPISSTIGNNMSSSLVSTFRKTFAISLYRYKVVMYWALRHYEIRSMTKIWNRFQLDYCRVCCDEEYVGDCRAPPM